ncbi:MAG: GNAT family N-acetyltransferase [Lachnospiraceae bacterium]|nr:GNAT family N-acetyltransferase [Lachnospiraceae bacterium]
MTVKKYLDSDKNVWNEFVLNSKNGIFMFNRDFVEYHKDRFTDNSLMFYDEDKLVAVMTASIRDGVLSSHGGLTYGGFITNNEMKQHRMNECFTALKEYASQNGIKEIVYKHIPHIYHKQPAEEDIYSLYYNGAEVLKIEASTVINLQQPLKMPKGRKAQVGRARREGVEIKESNDLEAFIELENQVLSEHHGTKAVHTADELHLLQNYFPENIKLIAAYYQEKLIAGTVIFIYDNVVHTQYMAANELAREIGALDLTISTLIDKYKDTKKWLDFGISTEEAGHYLNEGLISQKEGFGGRTNIYQTWRIKI